MILPLLLRALSLADLGDLGTLIVRKRGTIIARATKKLREDGDIARLNKPGPFQDADGESMTGNEFFTHNALYQVAKAIGAPGELADKIRDAYWPNLKPDAEALLVGVSGGREATANVLDRLVEQIP